MFFYSLPILFNDIQLVSPVECLLMTGAIFAVIYFTAPPPDQNWQHQPFDSFLLTSWLGGVSLYWVFWPFFLFLNASLLTADILAKSGIITVSSWDEIHLIVLLTVAWWMVSVWRCSGNTQARIWSSLARLATISVMVEFSLKLLIRIDYPRIFFNCEDILLDYGSCF
jgi:hypothetical protein